MRVFTSRLESGALYLNSAAYARFHNRFVAMLEKPDTGEGPHISFRNAECEFRGNALMGLEYKFYTQG